ncbi:MAG: branched-chain amino acid ABC transporter permease [Clostridiales bacterium]|jgi:branched-chain amino acid transport system permease protein|nr:branched-chain amino acid ABC transporter permease [Clostridiales bacterium]
MGFENKRTKFAVLAALFVLAAVLPLFLDNYTLNVLWNAMFYMLLALGLNIIVGYTGLCDLGYAAKFAIGAYTTGILIKTFGWNFWLTLPVSALVSALAACVIGAPTLKLRSDYLAIVTLGFAEIVRISARNLDITGSASGINAIERPYFFGIHLTKISHWYYVFFALVIVFIIISKRIRYSRFGRALAFIREDEDAAQAMGVNTTLFKLYAYIAGAVLGGITGSFYAVKMTSISPGSFDFTQSANILLAVILGGMGKIPGVIVGAAFFAIFPELFRDVPFVGNMRMLFFGLLLIVVMINRPQGLWPEKPVKR